jgi:hypothetical protein
MENLLPFIPTFFLVAFFSVFFLIMKYRRDRHFEMLQQVSLRRGGSVKKGFFLQFGTLTFPYASHEISVHSTPGSKNNPARTRVSCPLTSGRDFTMNLCSENFFLKAFKMFVGQDIEIGNDAFDRAFLVKGSDESSVRAILTPIIQERLLGLNPKGIDLRLSQTELRLEVRTIPKSEMDYDPILDAFTALLDIVRAGNY